MVIEKKNTNINTIAKMYKDVHLILASQEKKVFYVEDPSHGPT